MAKAKDGDNVKVHYKGTLDDGSVFDTSEGRDPLEFKMGEGGLIPAFEDGVRDMAVGENKKINIPAADAYGTRQKEAVLTLEKAKLPEGLDPKKGESLQMSTPEGQMMVAEVIDVTEEHLTVDANHPLADKDLTFEIEMVEIAEAKEEKKEKE